MMTHPVSVLLIPTNPLTKFVVVSTEIEVSRLTLYSVVTNL